jgi:hypothetical protein
MVFEVIGTSTTTLTDPTADEPALTRNVHDDAVLDDAVLDDAVLDEAVLDDAVLDQRLGPCVQPGAESFVAPMLPRRPLSPGVVRQLLRSAVALQAEGVLRTAGALAGAWGGVLDRTEWIQRDARDLSVLAAAAVDAQVPLPAGVDTGAGDPDRPGSVVESLLAGHEALVGVLRQLADATAEGEPAEPPSWRGAVQGILSRREEEILLLRAVGAVGDVPADERYVHGRPPRA